jgi:hypothetical protein
MNPLTINGILRLIATICFVLAIFAVPFSWQAMLGAGLAIWCASTLVP